MSIKCHTSDCYASNNNGNKVIEFMDWEDCELKKWQLEMKQLDKRETWDVLWSYYQSAISVANEEGGPNLGSR